MFKPVAIHHRPGSFSEGWIDYCEKKNVPYKVVDCFSSDIIHQLTGCRGLMWHWPNYDFKVQLFARQLTAALEQKGFPVFPNIKTCWHYDDKVAQKYLFEAIGAPLVSSYVFYNEAAATSWAKTTSYPKVWKLRSGAGSENVCLVRSADQAIRMIKRSFRGGWQSWSRYHPLKERLYSFFWKKNIESFFAISKGIARLFIPRRSYLSAPIEKNYSYFQDFIPDNDHDIRVIVVGKKAFALKRLVREGDFRASGSGRLVYDPTQIPIACIRVAFDVTRRINSQCAGYDFVLEEGVPKIIEVTYAFASQAYRACPGYWDEDLQWHDGNFFCEWFMIEDFLEMNGI